MSMSSSSPLPLARTVLLVLHVFGCCPPVAAMWITAICSSTSPTTPNRLVVWVVTGSVSSTDLTPERAQSVGIQLTSVSGATRVFPLKYIYCDLGASYDLGAESASFFEHSLLRPKCGSHEYASRPLLDADSKVVCYRRDDEHADASPADVSTNWAKAEMDVESTTLFYRLPSVMANGDFDHYRSKNVFPFVVDNVAAGVYKVTPVNWEDPLEGCMWGEQHGVSFEYDHPQVCSMGTNLVFAQEELISFWFEFGISEGGAVCEDPPGASLLANTEVFNSTFCSDVPDGFVCPVTCSHGFVKVSELKCEAGEWSSSFQCVEQYCSMPNSTNVASLSGEHGVADGIVPDAAAGCGYYSLVGAECRFSCSGGAQPGSWGDGLLRCQPDGSWEPAGMAECRPAAEDASFGPEGTEDGDGPTITAVEQAGGDPSAGTGMLRVHWEAPEGTDEKSAIEAYEFEVAPAGSMSCGAPWWHWRPPKGGLLCHGGSGNMLAYDVKVRAVNKHGPGAWSAPASAPCPAFEPGGDDATTYNVSACAEVLQGSSCLVDCVAGYILAGDAGEMNCSDLGDFSGVLPTCLIATNCSAPEGIAGAASPPCAQGDIVDDDSVCTPSCTAGFVPSHTSLACYQGVLTPSSFSCEPAPCAAPVGVQHAAGPCAEGGGSVSHGAECTPQCDEGFLATEDRLACSYGQLTPPTFACEASTTPAPGQTSTVTSVASVSSTVSEFPTEDTTAMPSTAPGQTSTVTSVAPVSSAVSESSTAVPSSSAVSESSTRDSTAVPSTTAPGGGISTTAGLHEVVNGTLYVDILFVNSTSQVEDTSFQVAAEAAFLAALGIQSSILQRLDVYPWTPASERRLDAGSTGESATAAFDYELLAQSPEDAARLDGLLGDLLDPSSDAYARFVGGLSAEASVLSIVDSESDVVQDDGDVIQQSAGPGEKLDGSDDGVNATAAAGASIGIILMGSASMFLYFLHRRDRKRQQKKSSSGAVAGPEEPEAAAATAEQPPPPPPLGKVETDTIQMMAADEWGDCIGDVEKQSETASTKSGRSWVDVESDVSPQTRLRVAGREDEGAAPPSLPQVDEVECLPSNAARPTSGVPLSRPGSSRSMAQLGVPRIQVNCHEDASEGAPPRTPGSLSVNIVVRMPEPLQLEDVEDELPRSARSTNTHIVVQPPGAWDTFVNGHSKPGSRCGAPRAIATSPAESRVGALQPPGMWDIYTGPNSRPGSHSGLPRASATSPASDVQGMSFVVQPPGAWDSHHHAYSRNRPGSHCGIPEHGRPGSDDGSAEHSRPRSHCGVPGSSSSPAGDAYDTQTSFVMQPPGAWDAHQYANPSDRPSAPCGISSNPTGSRHVAARSALDGRDGRPPRPAGQRLPPQSPASFSQSPAFSQTSLSHRPTPVAWVDVSSPALGTDTEGMLRDAEQMDLPSPQGDSDDSLHFHLVPPVAGAAASQRSSKSQRWVPGAGSSQRSSGSLNWGGGSLPLGSPAAQGLPLDSPAGLGFRLGSSAAQGLPLGSPAAQGHPRGSPAAQGFPLASPAAQGLHLGNPAAHGLSLASPSPQGAASSSSGARQSDHVSRPWLAAGDETEVQNHLSPYYLPSSFNSQF